MLYCSCEKNDCMRQENQRGQIASLLRRLDIMDDIRYLRALLY